MGDILHKRVYLFSRKRSLNHIVTQFTQFMLAHFCHPSKKQIMSLYKKNTFVLTERELIKVGFMIVLSVFLFGLTGLFIILFLQWITRQSYAADVVDKHGISQVSASRLGGSAVFACSLGLLILGNFSIPIDVSNGPLGVHVWGWVGAVSCAALGLTEDLLISDLVRDFEFSPKS